MINVFSSIQDAREIVIIAPVIVASYHKFFSSHQNRYFNIKITYRKQTHCFSTWQGKNIHIHSNVQHICDSFSINVKANSEQKTKDLLPARTISYEICSFYHAHRSFSRPASVRFNNNLHVFCNIAFGFFPFPSNYICYRERKVSISTFKMRFDKW